MLRPDRGVGNEHGDGVLNMKIAKDAKVWALIL